MKQYLVPVVVVILALMFLDPFMIVMPEMLFYIGSGIFFVAFALYAATVWNEQVADEREYAHRAYAGRVAYLVGATVAVIGILYQALVLHSVDPVLVILLLAMIIGKSLGLRHIQKRL
ncbi:hypothetical protein KC727_02115 [Candidatus Kaiserbacteria bacterium]|nr:hypothetical protein [Candidatus Kaiserbacteria bacterium]